MKAINQYSIFLMFLFLLLGTGTQLAAQERVPSFSNQALTNSTVTCNLLASAYLKQMNFE